jgi:hypothetical protein
MTSSATLLEAWERGCEASPGERGLILLSVARPEAPPSALADWPVGKRDAALLGLSGRLFGPRLAGQSNCPRCAALLEMELDVATLAASAPVERSDRFHFETDGFRIAYRLPSAGDLALLGSREADAAGKPGLRHWLLYRCVLEVQRCGAAAADRDQGHGTADAGMTERREPVALVQPAATAEIPHQLLSALEAAMARTVATADPLAEIALNLECPSCAAAWSAPFDIVNFLWDELAAWASRILGEIHTLALHYGWGERDILALSPRRRQHYLDLIGA